MDITVYLPDEIGQRAKAADLPFSQLLRAAVMEELERQAAVEETLSDTETFELDLVDDEGRPYTGRIVGACIAQSRNGEVEVYVAEDERVLIYDRGKSTAHEVGEWEDAEEVLRDWLVDDDAYIGAMNALGLRPTVDL